MGTRLTNELKKFILSGDFEAAKKISSKLSEEELDAELSEISYESESLTCYTFIMSLIVEAETEELHEIAFSMLVISLVHLEGAYYAALYHARRAIALTNEQDAGYLSNLLFLHSVPDTVVLKEEADKVAKKILVLEPNNLVANDFLREY